MSWNAAPAVHSRFYNWKTNRPLDANSAIVAGAYLFFIFIILAFFLRMTRMMLLGDKVTMPRPLTG